MHSLLVRVPPQTGDDGGGGFGPSEVAVATPTVAQPVDDSTAPETPRGGDGLPAEVSVSAATVAAPVAEGAIAGDEAPIHGVAQVQVSTPTITLPEDDDASRVTVHFDLMARWKPFSDSAELPEFIHGELRVTAAIERNTAAGGDLVSLRLDSDDVVVTFVPDPGSPLSPLHASRVNRAIDDYVRTAFEPINLNVNLPSGDGFAIQNWALTTLPGGTRPAVALLMNLRAGAVLTESQRLAYTSRFLGTGDGFALAIGADFLGPMLEQQIRNALDQATDQEITVGRPWPAPDCTYSISVQQVSVEFRAGQLVVHIRLGVSSPGFACFDYTLDASQAFTLDVTGGTVSLELDGDPDVDLDGWFSSFLEGRVRSEVESAMAQIPNRAQPMIDGLLDSFNQIFEGDVLRVSTLETGYQAAQITPHGLILRGDIEVTDWEPVVVASQTKAVTPDLGAGLSQLELNALESWVPGGTVQRYRWLYGSGDSPPEREILEEHRFLTRTSGSPRIPCYWCQWCLEVHGIQDGNSVVGSNCTITGGGVFELPPPEVPGDYRLPVGVPDASGRWVAYLDPWSGGDERSGRARATSTINLIVHFASLRPEDTVPQLLDALARRSEDRSLVYLVAVVEPGAAPQVERPRQPDGSGVQLSWAEDFEGDWRRRFEVDETPATFLIQRQGGTVWQQVGQLDSDELREALERHLVASSSVRYQQLRLRVREGDRAPDFLFEYAKGRSVALRSLRGRPIILCFWTSWSEPSLAELRRLQRLYYEQAQGGPRLLAINDGEDPDVARRAFGQNDLKLQLVPDPERRIARLYGVNCWPTTVSISERRLVQQIRFGRTPESAPSEPGEQQATQQVYEGTEG